MEISDQVYKGGTPSKTTTRADDDRFRHVRKLKGSETSSPTNPKKGRDGNRKNNYAGHMSDNPTGEKHACCMTPGHSSEELKVLKESSDKYTTHRPQKYK